MIGFVQSTKFTESSSWLPVEHRFSRIPGSSFGGKAMSWSHFERLKVHDEIRHAWLVANNANRNKKGSEFSVRTAARKNTEVGRGADFSLGGNADPSAAGGGVYYIRVSLGTPPQAFTVQIDTGSDLLWVNCQPCLACPTSSNIITLAPAFNQTQSSTFLKVSCDTYTCYSLQSSESQLGLDCAAAGNDCPYQLSYADGSTSSGTLSSDTLRIPGINDTNIQATVPFGCSDNLSGTLLYPTLAVDGLMGLGRASFSVPSVLANSSILAGTFSICLGGEVNGGGFLLLGVKPFLGSNPQSTPMVDAATSNLYYVGVTGISVGGTALSGVDSSTFGSGKGAIFDSGTTLAIVPNAVYIAMAEKLLSVVKLSQLSMVLTSGSYCWGYQDSGISSLPNYFPNASIEFSGGSSMILTPDNYILLSYFSFGGQAACFSWQNSGNGSGITIFGDIALRNKLITFDNENSVLEWNEFDCSGSNPTINGSGVHSTTSGSNGTSSINGTTVTAIKSSAQTGLSALMMPLSFSLAVLCCFLVNYS